MQSTSPMPWMSWRQKSRRGQIQVFEKIDKHITQLNVKLPTGYGKTFTMCGVYSILQKMGRVNRLLVVFPSEAQIDQFKKDGPIDLGAACVDGPLMIDDVSFYGAHAIKHHRSNSVQVFVITIQSLIQNRGAQNVKELFQTGQWMLCVDEYHHYGIEKSWGKSVLQLSRAFLLAMSATPSRPGDDSAFGVPDVSVLYRDAVEENSVKPLVGHAYAYRIDAVLDGGDIKSYTTTELAKEAGSENPDSIEKMRIKRKMRWSPKYVSPLINIPIERMLVMRMTSGYPLQALVGAMCVSHAELVCSQIREMYPELKVDWVGTGENGRSDDVNKKVLENFCPKKTEDGKRPFPIIDVLVHVGKAGEGLDCVYVSEYIFLNNATLCNKRIQEIGRASRYLDGVEGNINFDSSSEFSPYVGENIQNAMDFDPPDQEDEEEETKKSDEPPALPEEPNIAIFNMELLHIDSGDPSVQRFARVLESGNITGIDYEALKDKSHPEWQKIILGYKTMREIEAAPYNREAEIKQWQEAVNIALSAVTGRVVRRMMAGGARPEKSFPGDIKKRINTIKKAKLGPVQPDIEVFRNHWKWLRDLDNKIIEEGVPEWLL